MRHLALVPATSVIVVVGMAAVLAGCDDKSMTSSNSVVPIGGFVQTNLSADVPGSGAASIDRDLVNPWGLAFGPTGILWVANNHTGTSTLYDASGAKQSTIVMIPSSDGTSRGAPTGVVFNETTDFTILASPALFIFAGEDGVISAWNTRTGNAVVMADRSSSNAVYKGIAMASYGGENFLYATNFKSGQIDVFDRNFQFVKSFNDPTLPAGYAAFGIQNIGGRLYVTFAKQQSAGSDDDEPGPGNGFVDVFNSDGTMARRFASQGALNSPWAIAIAPAGFGAFGGDILIGNFGDGTIAAFDPASGTFLGFLQDGNNANIVIDGLWGLTFGPGEAFKTLYFAAGPSDEQHGLLGTLKPR